MHILCCLVAIITMGDGIRVRQFWKLWDGFLVCDTCGGKNGDTEWGSTTPLQFRVGRDAVWPNGDNTDELFELAFNKWQEAYGDMMPESDLMVDIYYNQTPEQLRQSKPKGDRPEWAVDASMNILHNLYSTALEQNAELQSALNDLEINIRDQTIESN